MKKIFVFLFLTFSLPAVFANSCQNGCFNTFQSTESGAYDHLNFGLGQCSVLGSSNCNQIKYDIYYYSVGQAIIQMNSCLGYCPQQ